jgi:hypothetical protein
VADTLVVLQTSTVFAVTLFGVGEAKSAGWEVDMSKSHLACTLSLTSIAAMMLGMTASQTALAQNELTTNKSMATRNSSQSSAAVDPGVRGGPPGAGGPVGGLTAAEQGGFAFRRISGHRESRYPLRRVIGKVGRSVSGRLGRRKLT